MRNVLSAAAALGLMVAPVAAQAGTRANDVVPAAAKVQRAVQTVDSESELAGGSAILIAILALAAVIAGVIIIADDDDNDSNG
ncbi:hypothetical protein [Qipengyuania marisflavi]|uniref:Uncharacterized protein n=1 Tax=Qipengyuania marisflavi TaxID=2486356 RepID=A0A5S3PT13_9SPHN|nr:hypothetical protein [Qipengyuania marisflavi]TMM46733.1 hypothetical protein FEV51_10905 [Qipengyuania marisflavi]